MSATRFDRHGPVAVLTIDNPPVNGLAFEVRHGILEALDRSEADEEIRALVLIGAGKGFSGGADIREFATGKVFAEPSLRNVIRAIEGAKKPVIAAIHGMAIGGGLELALGCHYRLAAPAAQIGLGEVKLGLLPGAGGTQRLPRLTGFETAMNMVVSGNPVPASALQETPLFDELVEGDLRERAIAFAEKAGAQKLPPLVKDLPVQGAESAEGLISFARNAVTALSKGYPAPLKALEAVAASVTQPFEEGLRTERDLFLQLMTSPEARALQHAFFAERAASKIGNVPEDTKTRPIRKAAVIGAGTMGGGISMNFANAGIPVAMLEVKEDALQKGLATVRKNYKRARGRESSPRPRSRSGWRSSNRP
jgi:3-hydroxyacyl-CoA dehydrogenase